jgi:riboflavin kinase/FMN adenylyltransferase
MAVIATGFFDGVHLGHRRVVEALVSFARRTGGEAVVVTFAQHPRAVLQQDARSLRLLTSAEEKEAMLYELGVDRVETLPFDRAFARLTASEYIYDVLIGRFDADGLVLGYDNRFGSDRLTPDRIVPLAESLGLEVQVVPPVVIGAVVVSSTKIREALDKGDVEAANAMLGYAYTLRGVVVGGKQLGRTLGFPTANLRLYDPLKMIPARGVYLTEVEVSGQRFWGMTNVGDIIETNIFDFHEDIYGLDLRLHFKKRLRDGKRFENLEGLKTQLAADEAVCRALLAGKA